MIMPTTNMLFVTLINTNLPPSLTQALEGKLAEFISYDSEICIVCLMQRYRSGLAELVYLYPVKVEGEVGLYVSFESATDKYPKKNKKKSYSSSRIIA